MARFARWIAPLLVGAAAFAAAGVYVERRNPRPAGALEIHARPEGASVYVDDRFRGIAAGPGPVRVIGLAPGRHVVRVDADGHLPRHAAVTLDRQNAAVRLVARPEPRGRLVVASDPPGARVLVDGLAAGITGATLELPPGRHVVSLAYPNHNAETRIVEIPAREPPAAPTRTTDATDTAGAAEAAEPDEPDAALPPGVAGDRDIAASGEVSASGSPSGLASGSASASGGPVEILRPVVGGPNDGAVYLFVPLRSRTAEMFRKRIADNPADIAAYNDFWVLLFDQDRLGEAAAVAVEGLRQGSLAKNPDQAAKDGFERLKREIRGKEGRTRMPRWKQWTAALDRAVIDAVREGRTAPAVLTEFNDRVSIDVWPDGYFEALGALAARPGNRAEIVRFVDFAIERGKASDIVPFFEAWTAAAPETLTDAILLMRGLQRARAKLEKPEDKEKAAAAMARVRAAAQPLRVPGKDGNWLWLEAAAARDEGRVDDWRRFAEASIDATLSIHLRANQRRLELASELVKANDPRAKAKGAALVAYIVNQNLGGDKSVNPARQLRDRLVAEKVPVADAWPAAFPVTDWLVAGPFALPEGGGIDRPFEPERQPFVRDQLFADAGPAASWRRVEWLAGEPFPAEAFLPGETGAPDKTDKTDKTDASASARGGVVYYARSWVYSRQARNVELEIATRAPFRLCGLDGKVLVERKSPAKEVEAVEGGGAGEAAAESLRATLPLRPGFTPVLLKWTSPAAAPPESFVLTVRDPKNKPLTFLRASAARL